MSKFQTVMPRVMSSDLVRTIHFYRDLLDFELNVLWPDANPTFCILRRDSVRLGFFLEDEHHPRIALGATEYHIDVEDVKSLHEKLSGRCKIEWGPEVFFYGRREFAIRDPDGYLLIFSEMTNDPPTCPEE